MLPATLARVGSVTVIGWVIAACGALALALLFGRVARRKPLPGGPASYVHAVFGPFAGFQASMWYWAACLIGNVAIAAAAAGYLAAVIGGPDTPFALAMLTIALLWLVTVINLVSPRFVGQVDGPLLVAGLIPLLLIATLGWFAFDAAQFRASWNVSGLPYYQALPESLVLVFWAFTGLESASVAAAVVENPERNVPLATIAGVAMAALIYIAASAAIMGLAPAPELAASSAPFALVAARALGPVAGPLIAAAAMLKALGTLAGWVLLTSQVSRAAADNGLLPRAFGRTRAGDTPVFGLVISALIGTAAIVVTISPTLGQQFGLLIEASTIFALLTYLGACLAALRQRAPGETLVAVIGGVFCVAVIGWSSMPVLATTFACMLLFTLAWLVRPAADARHARPDARR